MSRLAAVAAADAAPRPPLDAVCAGRRALVSRCPLYFAQRPSRLLDTRYIVLERHDGTYVAYPRQETPMPTARAADPDALCTEFHAEVMAYLDARLREGERERRIQELWAAIKRLEAGGTAGDAG
jgi:hypothetical protein